MSEISHESTIYKFEQIFIKLEKCDDSFLQKEIPFNKFKTQRVINNFSRLGIKTFKDLLNYGPDALIKFHGIGCRSVKEIIKIVNEEIYFFKSHH